MEYQEFSSVHVYPFFGLWSVASTIRHSLLSTLAIICTFSDFKTAIAQNAKYPGGAKCCNLKI